MWSGFSREHDAQADRRPARGTGVIRVADLAGLPHDRPLYVAIGSFDGVHVGHQAVLRALVGAAAAAGALAAVLTFRPHPLAVLKPGSAPPALATPEERARLIAGFGVDALVELRFDRELADLPAEEFVADHLVRRAAAGHVFVGQNFSFGRGGLGRPADIGRRLPVTVIPPVVRRGEPVSSTRVRAAVQSGRTGLARVLLGRFYSLTGAVVPGDGRGRTIGFPTANVAVDPGLALPALGVYAVAASFEGRDARSLPGVANLGVRPTFVAAGAAAGLEVHLFDFNADVYGCPARVDFVRRLRGERRFAGAAALVSQIGHDVERARRVLGLPQAAAGPRLPGE